MAPADSETILDKVLEIAGDKGWTGLTMEMVAEGAGVPLADLTRAYPRKSAILNALADRFEQLAEVATDPEACDPSLPVPERLFDAIMTRFELMQEHRDGYVAIIGAARRDPCMALTGATRLQPAMGIILRQTGLEGRGLSGFLRRKVLSALYLSVLQVWLKDESEDLGPTMAALDKRLRQLDEIVMVTPFRGKTRQKENSKAGA